MELLKKLHQLEREKKYQEYCDMAELILKKEKENISPTNSLHIKKRRNYYLKRLNRDNEECLEINTILSSLNEENLKILKKCCPRIEEKATSKKDQEQNEILTSEQTLLSATITKDKYLKIDFDSTKNSLEGSKYYFYQALLTSDLKLKLLNSQTVGEFQEIETQVITLENEFMPVFIVNADTKQNKIKSLQLIYFPSMIPGGYHYAELVNAYCELNIMESIEKYAKKIKHESGLKLDYLLMKPGHQDLGIAYSNEDFRKWISNVHGIRILKEYDQNIKDTILSLPQKTYPTISVIVNGILDNIYSDENVHSVEILFANEFDYDPIYNLQASFPKPLNKKIKNRDIVYPYLITEKTTKYPQNKDIKGPICISHGDKQAPYYAHPILPFDSFNGKEKKAENKEIFIIVNVESTDNISEDFILSISKQSEVTMNKIILISNSKNTKKLKNKLKTILEEWQVLIDFEIINNPNQIATVVSDGSHILFINEFIALQDSSIVSTLQSILVKYNAFSSGCIVSHLSSSKKRELYEKVSCGLYPTFNDFSQSGRLSLEAKNVASLTRSTEINVLANHYDFCLYNSDAILAGIARNELLSDLNQFLVHLSCKAVLDGENNICTTKTSVQYVNYPTLNNMITLDTSLTEKIINNFYNIRKYITNIKELMP